MNETPVSLNKHEDREFVKEITWYKKIPDYSPKGLENHQADLAATVPHF